MVFLQSVKKSKVIPIFDQYHVDLVPRASNYTLSVRADSVSGADLRCRIINKCK